MNSLRTLFIGFTITFTLAWLGLVIIPYFQLGQLAPQVDEDAGMSYPLIRSGLAERGKQVYQANGCIYCHSQQVRPMDADPIKGRGWGPRRTVARDYIYDKPHLLGTMRTGPDLTNIGKRQPSADWHHAHLYAPQSMAEYSVMPPYRYIYTVQKIKSTPNPKAVKLAKGYQPEEGYEVIPTPDAIALVAYLQSMDRTYALPEAPLPKE